MELTRSGAASEVQRCPYCHSSVAPEAEDWVACKQCLARHHRACWDEGHRCASCSATTPLVAEAPPRALAAGDVIAPLVGVETAAPDDLRREASRLLEEGEQRHEGFAAAILSYPTLGLYPILTSEKALQNHANANLASFGPTPTVAPDLRTRIDEAKGRAFAKRLGDGRRTLAAFTTILVAVGTIFAILLTHMTRWNGETDLVAYDWGVIIAWATYAIFQISLAIQLHWFREAVRRHEYDQFYARLVADAVHPTRIKEISEARRKAWADCRGNDLAGTFFFLLFGPLFMLPFLGSRMRYALALHMKHEESLLQTAAPARKDPE